MSYDNQYIEKQCANALTPLGYTPPTLQEQIEARIVDLKTNLQKQEELLELLKRNPDIQRVFELMR